MGAPGLELLADRVRPGELSGHVLGGALQHTEFVGVSYVEFGKCYSKRLRERHTTLRDPPSFHGIFGCASSGGRRDSAGLIHLDGAGLAQSDRAGGCDCAISAWRPACDGVRIKHQSELEPVYGQRRRGGLPSVARRGPGCECLRAVFSGFRPGCKQFLHLSSQSLRSGIQRFAASHGVRYLTASRKSFGIRQGRRKRPRRNYPVSAEFIVGPSGWQSCRLRPRLANPPALSRHFVRGYRWRPKLRPPDGGRKLGRDPGERLGWNPELGVFDPLPKVCPAVLSPRFNPPVAYFELL